MRLAKKELDYDVKERTNVKDCSELDRTAGDRNHWKNSVCLPSLLEWEEEEENFQEEPDSNW